jgi:hypothetical protein
MLWLSVMVRVILDKLPSLSSHLPVTSDWDVPFQMILKYGQIKSTARSQERIHSLERCTLSGNSCFAEVHLQDLLIIAVSEG